MSILPSLHSMLILRIISSLLPTLSTLWLLNTQSLHSFHLDLSIDQFELTGHATTINEDILRIAKEKSYSEFQPLEVETPVRRNAASYTLHVIIEDTSKEENILTEEKLTRAQSVQHFVMSSEVYSKFCLQTRDFQCALGNSPLNYFFPSEGASDGSLVFDGEGSSITSIPATLSFLNSNGLQGFFDKKYLLSLNESRFLNTQFYFGTPLEGYSNYMDRKEEQRSILSREIQKFDEMLKKLNRELEAEGIRLVYAGAGILEKQVLDELAHDIVFAVASFVAVFVYSWINTSSLFLTVAGLLQIILAFPPAIAVFSTVFGLDFTLLTCLVLWIIVGIGVDDIYVVCDSWAQAPRRKKDNSLSSHSERLAYMYRTSGVATLMTSLTTAVSFFGLYFSVVLPLSQFGLLMSLLVVFNYVLVMTWFPCCIILREKYFLCCSKAPEQTDQTASQSGRTMTRKVRFMRKYANALFRLRYWVFAVTVTCVAVFAFQVTRIRSPDEPFALLPSDHNFELYRKYTKDIITNCERCTLSVDESVKPPPVVTLPCPAEGCDSSGDEGSGGDIGNGGGEASGSSFPNFPLLIPISAANALGRPSFPYVESVELVNSSTAVVKWNPPLLESTSIEEYAIAYSPDRRDWTIAQLTYIPRHLTSGWIGGLLPARRYFVTVVAGNAIGWGYPSAPVEFTTPSTLPDPPIITSVRPSMNTATVEWTAPLYSGDFAVSGYELLVTRNGNKVTVYKIPKHASRFVIADLCLETLSIAMRSLAANFKGNFSDSLSVSTVEGVPATPLLPTVTNVSFDSATLYLSPSVCSNGSPVSAFILEASTQERWVSVAERKVPGYVTVSGLGSSSTYVFRAIHLNSFGKSAESEHSTVSTRSLSPDPPLESEITQISPHFVAVQWKAPEYVGADSNIKYYVTISSANQRISLTTNSTSTSVSDLARFTEYSLKITASNLHGNSSAVTLNAFTEKSLPTPPRNLQYRSLYENALENGVLSLRFEWKAPLDMGGDMEGNYEIVFYSKETSGNHRVVHRKETGTDLFFTWSLPRSSSALFSAVYVNNSIGASPSSNVVEIKDSVSSTHAVRTPNVTSITDRSAMISWDNTALIVYEEIWLEVTQNKESWESLHFIERVLEGLRPGTEYFVRVGVFSVELGVEHSEIVAFTTIEGPVAVMTAVIPPNALPSHVIHVSLSEMAMSIAVSNSGAKTLTIHDIQSSDTGTRIGTFPSLPLHIPANEIQEIEFLNTDFQQISTAITLLTNEVSGRSNVTLISYPSGSGAVCLVNEEMYLLSVVPGQRHYTLSVTISNKGDEFLDIFALTANSSLVQISANYVPVAVIPGQFLYLEFSLVAPENPFDLTDFLVHIHHNDYRTNGQSQVFVAVDITGGALFRRVSEVSNSSMRLHWDYAKQSARFLLEISSRESEWSLLAVTDQTEFLVTSLTRAVVYAFRLKTESRKGVSEYSEVFEVKTLPDVPSLSDVVIELKNSSDSHLQLYWNYPENDGGERLHSFYIYVNALEKYSETIHIQIHDTDEFSYALPVNAFVEYKVRIGGVNSAGEQQTGEFVFLAPTCGATTSETICGGVGDCLMTDTLGHCSCLDTHIAANFTCLRCPLWNGSVCGDRGDCYLSGAGFPVCKCRYPFFGESCEHSECLLGDNNELCNGRGKCVSGSCACESGYAGSGCEMTCPGECNGVGKCIHNSAGLQCECFKGYKGTECGTQCPVDDSGSICGHGTCSVEGHCECEEDYFGQDCSLQCPKDAAGVLCSGNGVCSVMRNAPICECNANFTGIDCSQNNDPQPFILPTSASLSLDFMWGVTAIHNESVVLDANFAFNGETQLFLLETCRLLFADALLRREETVCLLEDFKEYADTHRITWPVKEDTPVAMKNFLRSPSGSKYKSHVGYDTRGDIVWVSARAVTFVDRELPGSALKDTFSYWSDFISGRNSEAPLSCSSGLQTSTQWPRVALELSFISGTLVSCGVALCTCFLCMLVFTRSARVTVFGMLVLLCVVISMTGVYVTLGWTLGAIEAISISLVVGVGIDYILHIGHVYIVSRGSPMERTREALETIGMSIVSAAVTTILSTSVLLMCKFVYFVQFGAIMGLSAGISIFFSAFFFPAILLIFESRKN